MWLRRARTLLTLVLALGALAGSGVAASRAETFTPDPAVVAAREADRTYLALDQAAIAAMTLDELAAVFNTPTKIWYLIERTITYAYDRQVWGVDEYFATAEELWAKKRGDCEDYAAFAKALLDRAGYTTVLFSAWRQERDAGGNDGHTVVAFLENGRWNHISNLGYIRAEATTQEELASSIFPNWTRSNTWVYTGPAQTRDGLNGWRVATMIANRGTGGRTVVQVGGPRGAGETAASGN